MNTTGNNTGASPEVMRRLRKLLELAQRGVEGEKDNAERMLAKTMAKYGVKMEELDDQQTSLCMFTITNSNEERLLAQVLHRVLQKDDIRWRVRRRKAWVQLTKAQHVEVGMLYSIYRRQLKTELDRLYVAFIHKHKIFSNAPRDPNEKREPMSHEEYLRLKRMMAGLETVHVHKQIGEE